MKKQLIMCSIVILLLSLSLSAFAGYLGDVDNDGKVSAVDARIILRHSAKLDNIAEDMLAKADIDKNGSINAVDARAVLRMGAMLDELIEEHTHDYKTTEIQKQDCKNDGIIEYRCKTCDHSYQDVRKTKGHDYFVSVIKEPTCGIGTRQYDCVICGYIYTEDIPATEEEHNYISEIIKKPECAASGTKKYSCKVCGDTYTEKIEATGHKYSEKIVKEPACETEGLKEYECEKCKHTYNEEIAPTGHKYADATCLDAKICSVCKKTDGEPLGHTTNEGICERCGEKVSARQDAIDAENETHAKNLAKIDASYDSIINIKTNTLRSLMAKNGIYTLYSKSYYSSLYNSLYSEYSNLMAKASYSSGSAAASYRRQAQAVLDEMQVVNIAIKCVDMYDEINRLSNSKQNAVNAENARHTKALQDINEKFG